MMFARLLRPAGYVALAVTAVTAVLGVGGCRSASTAAASAASPGPSALARPSHRPAPTDRPSARGGATSSAVPRPRPSTPRTPASALPLGMGSSGPDVTQLQQRLTALGYWLGAVDGRFGSNTQQAVFALQKAAGQRPTGKVTAATEAALRAGTRPRARSGSGRLIEVDLAHGLLLFVTNGHVDYALNTSTGGGYVYYDQGVRGVAVTPKGHFRTYRVVDGPDRSTLGLLIRPRYFTGGYAIHGDSYVPARPVSHGCVRVTEAAINWIWSANLDPIGTTVWVY